MSPWAGRAVLIASGLGFPLTQVAISRFGRSGAVLTEAVAAGLLARDAALIAKGTPERLRTGPARLLYAETAAAAAAAVLCLPVLAARDPRARAAAARPGVLEAFRRFFVGTLFGMHTMRFRVYLSADRGLRAAPNGV